METTQYFRQLILVRATSVRCDFHRDFFVQIFDRCKIRSVKLSHFTQLRLHRNHQNSTKHPIFATSWIFQFCREPVILSPVAHYREYHRVGSVTVDFRWWPLTLLSLKTTSRSWKAIGVWNLLHHQREEVKNSSWSETEVVSTG